MPGLVPQQTATSLLEQCLPLYTLLAALGNPTVHWFILDIEGAEFQVGIIQTKVTQLVNFYVDTIF